MFSDQVSAAIRCSAMVNLLCRLSIACVAIFAFYTCGVAHIRPALGSPTDSQNKTMPEDRPELRLGEKVERDMAGGGAHNYRIELSSGQYLHLVVEQKGLDVIVALYGPHGKKLVEVDSPNGTEGPEPLSWIAEETGSYRLEVRSDDKKAAAGRYEAKIEDLRQCTSKDRSRVLAEKTYLAAWLVLSKGTREALETAIQGYSEALSLWLAAGDRKGEAQTLNNIGGAYDELGRKDEALDYYNRALAVARSAGDQAGEANTLNNIGALYDSMGQRQKALEYYNQSLRIVESLGNRFLEAATLDNIGQVYYYLHDGKSALDYYNRALTMRRTTGDRRGEGTSLHNLALLYSNLGNGAKALERLEEALAVEQSLGDLNGQASSLSAMGGLYWSQGQMQESVDYYNRALKIQEEVGAQRSEAYTLTNLGVVYADSGDGRKALDYYNRALPIRKAVGDRLGEASTLHNIGVVYADLGEKQKALDCYSQALPLERAVGERSGEATTLQQIGSIYLSLGEAATALNYYNLALAIRRAIGDQKGEGYTLHNIGLAYDSMRDEQEALGYYDQALALERAVGNRAGEGATLRNIGMAYASLGQNGKALEYYSHALTLQRAVGDRDGEGYTLSSTASALDLLGQKEPALDHYGQAQAAFAGTGDMAGEAATLYRSARTVRGMGRLAQARSNIEAAISIVESLRTKVSNPNLRSSYFATVQDYYSLYIDLLMNPQQGPPPGEEVAAALQASERARARSLLELITEGHADIRQGVDPELLGREHSLQELLDSKAERLTRILTAKHTEMQAAAAKKEVDELGSRYQDLEAEIRANNPRYAALTQPRPLTIKEIQQLLDHDSLLLEYSTGDDRSYVWAVTPDSISSHELPRLPVIDDAAKKLYQLVTARNEHTSGETNEQWSQRVAEADKQLPETAAKLGQMVLGPVVSELGRKRLIVVTEGALQYIPFQLLPVPAADGKASSKYKPLVTEHEIINLPSASALAILRRDTANRKPAEKMVAVLADPVFDSDDQRVRSVAAAPKAGQDSGGAGRSESSRPVGNESPTSESITALFNTRVLTHIADKSTAQPTTGAPASLYIPRLPYTRQEADQIAALAGAEAMEATGFKASCSLAESGALSRYRYIHFATHGYLDTERPELSAIVLSLVDEQGNHQDGFLRANDIFNLNLPAEMVVLSACQTGLGKDVRGEGLVGLTRAFMYAGAKRVLVSMWSVNDRATAELMAKVYKRILKEGKTPGEALRDAQIEMWKKKQWPSPFYWAAFELQGEWQ